MMSARVVGMAIMLAFSNAALADDSTTLLRQVQGGNVILYMRHGATDIPRDTSPAGAYEDCSWQRKLTDEGRAQARIAHDAIARLAVPVERVLVSPMCRTMETARIAFGRAEPVKDLLVVASVRRMLAVKPTPGKVTVIVGHELPGLGFEPMKETETVVVRPRDGGFDVLGRLTPQDWQRWMP